MGISTHMVTKIKLCIRYVVVVNTSMITKSNIYTPNVVVMSTPMLLFSEREVVLVVHKRSACWFPKATLQNKLYKCQPQLTALLLLGCSTDWLSLPCDEIHLRCQGPLLQSVVAPLVASQHVGPSRASCAKILCLMLQVWCNHTP